MTPSNEIGSRLKVDELRARTVVVVTRVDRPTFATMWVEGVFDKYVLFQSGATGTTIHFLAKRLSDGKMVDDTGAEVQVFEYLGKV